MNEFLLKMAITQILSFISIKQHRGLCYVTMKEVSVSRCIFVWSECGLHQNMGALNERVLSKESIIQVLGLEKSGSDVQAHEVITDKDVLSSRSGGKNTGNGERKSNNP